MFLCKQTAPELNICPFIVDILASEAIIQTFYGKVYRYMTTFHNSQNPCTKKEIINCKYDLNLNSGLYYVPNWCPFLKYFCHWLIQPFTPGTGLTQCSVQHKVICF